MYIFIFILFLEKHQSIRNKYQNKQSLPRIVFENWTNNSYLKNQNEPNQSYYRSDRTNKYFENNIKILSWSNKLSKLNDSNMTTFENEMQNWSNINPILASSEWCSLKLKEIHTPSNELLWAIRNNKPTKMIFNNDLSSKAQSIKSFESCSTNKEHQIEKTPAK